MRGRGPDPTATGVAPDCLGPGLPAGGPRFLPGQRHRAGRHPTHRAGGERRRADSKEPARRACHRTSPVTRRMRDYASRGISLTIGRHDGTRPAPKTTVWRFAHASSCIAGVALVAVVLLALVVVVGAAAGPPAPRGAPAAPKARQARPPRPSRRHHAPSRSPRTAPRETPDAGARPAPTPEPVPAEPEPADAGGAGARADGRDATSTARSCSSIAVPRQRAGDDDAR